MAKQKGPPGIQNRHIYTRASYLYQAANYLAKCVPENNHDVQKKETKSSGETHSGTTNTDQQRKAMLNMSRQTVADMRSVSLKAQIRQSPALKRTICKFCDTLQVEGQTCESIVENQSKGGRKPWADILVIRCKTCGNSKRYPINAPRQKRASLRDPTASIAQSSTDGDAMDITVTTTT